MKIKQQKQLNLAQLIEHVWNNEVTDKSFICKEDGSECTVRHKVTINKFGKFNLDSHNYYKESDLFTVEVEEEITEDTPLSMIIEIDEDSSCWVFENTTLKNIHEINCGTNTTKYYRDENENMHIIWRDGEMVE